MPLIQIPEVASNAPDKPYDVSNFNYNDEKYFYTCPQRQVLKTNGRWDREDRGKSFAQMKYYKTKAFGNCPVKSL